LSTCDSHLGGRILRRSEPMSRGERYWALIERNWRCQPYDPPPVPWLMENEFIASYPLPGQKERAEGGDRNRQTLCPGNGARVALAVFDSSSVSTVALSSHERGDSNTPLGQSSSRPGTLQTEYFHSIAFHVHQGL
jgi:hypothetical protein